MTDPTDPSPSGEAGDIVERLRAEGENAMRQHLSLGMHKLCGEAADKIADLQAQKAGLEAMLTDAQEVPT